MTFPAAGPEPLVPRDIERRYAIDGQGFQGAADQVIVGLPPVDPSSPAARLTQAEGIRHLLRVLLLVAVACLGAEAAATVALRRMGPADLEPRGPEEALLKVLGPASRRPYVLLLGDSVMKDGALVRAKGAGARELTIPTLLAHRFAKDLPGASLVDLAMEGALVNDHAGLVNLLLSRSLIPSAVILQLDYRVLSPVQDRSHSLSRRWLRSYVPFVEPAAHSSPESLSRPIDEWTRGALLGSQAYVLLRGGRHLASNAALGVLGSRSAAPEPPAPEPAAVKLVLSDFYGTDRSVEQSEVLMDLLRFVDTLVAQRIPALVSFTPANFEYLGASVNSSVYRANVADLEQAIQDRYAGTPLVRWVAFEGEIPPSMFIDHCHLTPVGNRVVAERLFENLALLLEDAY